MDQDTAWIEQIKQGDYAALNSLMEKYNAPLYYFIYRFIHDEHEARDVLQETFVKVYFRAASFKPGYTVRTWIYSIAANLCRDHYRRKQTLLERSLTTLEDWSLLPGKELSPSQTVEQSEFANHVQKAIDSLSPELKLAFVLSVFDGMSHKECGKVLGKTAKAVERMVSRARQKLQAILGE